jgi:hypothetical protein
LELELDELTGPNFADSSGLGQEAVLVGSGLTTGMTGHSRSAVSMTGSAALTVAGTTRMPRSSYVLAEAWVNPQQLSGNHVILTRPGSYSLEQNGAEVSFSVTAEAQTSPCVATTTGASLVSGQWSHVAAWYDGLAISVTINGQLRVRANCRNGPLAWVADAPFHVGGLAQGTQVLNGFVGALDEVRVRQGVPAANYPADQSIRQLTAGTIYRNDSGRKLLVVAYGNAIAANAELSGVIGSASPPTRLVASESGGDRKSISFVIPPSWYYKVDLTAGSLTAEAWEL